MQASVEKNGVLFSKIFNRTKPNQISNLVNRKKKQPRVNGNFLSFYLPEATYYFEKKPAF